MLETKGLTDSLGLRSANLQDGVRRNLVKHLLNRGQAASTCSHYIRATRNSLKVAQMTPGY